MADQIGPRAMWRHLKENVPLWAEQLPKLPSLFFDVLEQAKEGKISVELKAKQMDELRGEIRKANHRTFAAILGSSLIISASVFAALDGFQKAMIAGAPFLSWVLGGLGVALVLAAWPKK
jgi:ubiquinone biosynthesis protein